MPREINTSRLLLWGVHRKEGREYATINELQCSDRDAADIIADWNSRGAIQLFIITRAATQGPRSLTAREGMVIGFIQVSAEWYGVSEISSNITHPDVRGNGYMREALAAVFDYAFDRLQRRDLFLETRSDAVQCLMRSLGLHRYARQGSE
jgi:RimJ/RimL family protein N-acetyltransferase